MGRWKPESGEQADCGTAQFGYFPFEFLIYEQLFCGKDDSAGPESQRVITPHSATDSAAQTLAVSGPAPEGEAGKGELNNAASWDDFPNGRFGDFKSPAYGETDLWGSSIMSVSIYRRLSCCVCAHY